MRQFADSVLTVKGVDEDARELKGIGEYAGHRSPRRHRRVARRDVHPPAPAPLAAQPPRADRRSGRGESHARRDRDHGADHQGRHPRHAERSPRRGVALDQARARARALDRDGPARSHPDLGEPLRDAVYQMGVAGVVRGDDPRERPGDDRAREIFGRRDGRRARHHPLAFLVHPARRHGLTRSRGGPYENHQRTDCRVAVAAQSENRPHDRPRRARERRRAECRGAARVRRDRDRQRRDQRADRPARRDRARDGDARAARRRDDGGRPRRDPILWRGARARDSDAAGAAARRRVRAAGDLQDRLADLRRRPGRDRQSALSRSPAHSAHVESRRCGRDDHRLDVARPARLSRDARERVH